MVMRVATFFPSKRHITSTATTSSSRSSIVRRSASARYNAFLAIDDVAALQAAADRLSPDIIRKRLDYGPDPRAQVSVKERKRVKLSRFYAISQIEYCRNFIFKRNFPIHKLFERRLRARTVAADSPQDCEISRPPTPQAAGKLATVIDQIEHGHPRLSAPTSSMPS